ncbi:MAG: ABC transporter permease [Clostridia bacterium]|nr:ABC transporter permease [Clostridia bacterium]
MSALKTLVWRNSKLFFKDKGTFFTSLITPVILLVLYVTFLANVYRDSFLASVGQGVQISEEILNSLVGGQLVSSLIAVSCVTVAFCANMRMVDDKVTGAVNDLTIAPIKGSVMALGYYLSTVITTLLICLFALCICLVYLFSVGGSLGAGDILLLALDTFLLVMFGTALSSVINFFLSSQGQISAVGTIVSSGYGFICGAYMPISSFPQGLQKVISFLPGTYGTSLVRNHALMSAFEKMESEPMLRAAIEPIKNAVDCNLYFFGSRVETGTMYAVLIISITVLMGIYVIMNIASSRKAR